MATRRRAREVVLQLLYEADLNPEGRDARARAAYLWRRLQGRKGLVEFATRLLEGVLTNREQIDRTLERHATNWSLSRMVATDRNLLRLATYEILFGDTPGAVAINEAVELAKRYGDRNSAAFVNGVLDRVLRGGETKATKQPPPPPSRPSLSDWVGRTPRKP